MSTSEWQRRPPAALHTDTCYFFLAAFFAAFLFFIGIDHHLLSCELVDAQLKKASLPRTRGRRLPRPRQPLLELPTRDAPHTADTNRRDARGVVVGNRSETPQDRRGVYAQPTGYFFGGEVLVHRRRCGRCGTCVAPLHARHLLNRIFPALAAMSSP